MKSFSYIDDDIAQSFNQWMGKVRNSARPLCCEGKFYAGIEGAKRLARECGPAILDFGAYGEKNIGSTYSAICVIAYGLKPPIDAKVWFQELKKGMDHAKEFDKRRSL